MNPLRHSDLKRVGDCPARFANPIQREESFFDKGSGVHSALLGGKRMVIWDKVSDKGNQCPRRGKDFDAFAALNVGSLILLPDEHKQVNGMVAAVQANKDAMALLAGRKEKTLLWDIVGRPCRGTPDVDNGHNIVELKTSKSADPRFFWRDSWKYCYHGALAWYMDGIARQWPTRRVLPEEAFIVAVETVWPYFVTVFRVPGHALEAGRRQNRAWFDRLRECEKSGKFPAYAEGIVDLEFPEKERQFWDVSAEEAA